MSGGSSYSSNHIGDGSSSSSISIGSSGGSSIVTKDELAETLERTLGLYYRKIQKELQDLRQQLAELKGCGSGVHKASRRKCYNCGDKGHLATDCRQHQV